MRATIAPLSIASLIALGCLPDTPPPHATSAPALAPADVGAGSRLEEPTDAKNLAPAPTIARDPFESRFDTLALLEGEKGALEKLPLESWKLKGTVVHVASPIAMVEGPGGETHDVRVGMRIGTNSGTITRIESGALVVEEHFRTFAGELVKNTQRLEMKRPVALAIP